MRSNTSSGSTLTSNVDSRPNAPMYALSGKSTETSARSVMAFIGVPPSNARTPWQHDLAFDLAQVPDLPAKALSRAGGRGSVVGMSGRFLANTLQGCCCERRCASQVVRLCVAWSSWRQFPKEGDAMKLPRRRILHV